MNLIDKIIMLQKNAHSYEAQRAVAQLRYVFRISEVNENKYDPLIQAAADDLLADLKKHGAITIEAAKACEEMLSVLSCEAKKYTLLCVAHAHIDMNWMWGFHETVAITLDTFRTVLRLLREYPELTFSQSQTSTYEIVEKYAPELFAEIKQMVTAGRWEVTASTWVETDKNLPSGESLVRHLLYTKKYFKEKFNLPEDALLLDFEPDTFGHNASVPEILSKGGIKYYYHCRGYNGHHIYNWKSPSGAVLLVQREPNWYNAQVDYDFADFLPAFCKAHGTDRMLRVFGVGDHGGGPTRRDIERLLDMKSWPCYANIEFSTYHDYFAYLESMRDKFPTVEGELNYIFTGCYSSQARIKLANRTAEDSLNAAECLTAFDVATGGSGYADGYRTAWQKTLFNQFHDILPGSCVRESREHALGEFAKVMGYTYAGRAKALASLAAKIDTANIKTEFDPESFADGAGMGYKGVAQGNSALVAGFETQICDTGCGKTRILHIFNTTGYTRSEAFSFPLWDWNGDIERLAITDSNQNEIPFFVAGKREMFWTHTCINITAFVTVPAFGYITLIVSEGESKELSPKLSPAPRVEEYLPNILENERISAKFDDKMQLVSLVDKQTGRQFVASPSGYFSVCWQNHKATTVMNGNAWVEGYPLKEENINECCPVFVTERNYREKIQQSISYELEYRNSKLKVKVSLDEGSSVLKYNVDVDWHERFSEKEGIPALKFNLPFAFPVNEYTYEIPFGTIKRGECNHDVPAIGFGVVVDGESGRSLILMTDSVYAYRGEKNAFKLTMLRATQFPDPCPEEGLHSYRIGAGICDPDEYFKYSDTFNYPLYSITNTAHSGSLPQTMSLFTISDNIAISAVKPAEDESGVIIRAFDATGEGTVGTINLAKDFRAQVVDLLERPCAGKLKQEGRVIAFELKPNEIISVKLIDEKSAACKK